MSTNKQALRIPEREKHNWGQAVMHTCDFCGQYAMAITSEDGEHSCASCLDAEYATVLTCALEMAIDRAEAAEARVSELGGHLKSAHAFIENTEAFGYEAASGILKCGDSEWNVDASKESLAAAGISVKGE
ncbi:hypothetical protein [Lelliottia amnigena]|uniref:hypothetical protein n=1 Tax=Lelliottia amnigena TaxID=61646 RepID=UPI00293BCDE6|nr:hypothetical protein [Lelliottia amnigena]